MNAAPAASVRPGRLVDGRWWCCCNCGQRLGEIVGRRVVIRYERRQWSQSLAADPEQTCPKCGQVSGPPAAVASE